MVYLGFPFETITTKANRDTLMRRVYRYIDVPTGVEVAGASEIPTQTQLLQNYPNPFNPTTTLEFRVANSARLPSSINHGGQGFVSLKVFDLLGREVATLVNQEMLPGNNKRTFNAEGLASGTYYYRLQAMPAGRQVGSFIQTKKMLLLR